MSPESVQFTGLEIRPCDLAWRRILPGPFPAHWQRVAFSYRNSETWKLRAWLLEHMNGRMGLITTFNLAVVYFEEINDAILFRLKDGPEAWCEDTPSF